MSAALKQLIRPSGDPQPTASAPSPAHRNPKHQTRIPVALCGGLLTPVVLFKLSDLAIRWQWWPGPLPSVLHRIVQLAALDQRWDMFQQGGGPDSRLLAFS